MKVRERFQVVRQAASVNPEMALELMDFLKRSDDPSSPLGDNPEVRERLASPEFLKVMGAKPQSLMALVRRKETRVKATSVESLRLMDVNPDMADHLAALSKLAHGDRNCAELLLDLREHNPNAKMILESAGGERKLAEYAGSSPKRVGEVFDSFGTENYRRAEEILTLGGRAYVDQKGVDKDCAKMQLSDEARVGFNTFFAVVPELSHKRGFMQDFAQSFGAGRPAIALLNALTVVARNQSLASREEVIRQLTGNSRMRQNLTGYMEVVREVASITPPEECGLRVQAILSSQKLGEHFQSLRELPISRAGFIQLVRTNAGSLNYGDVGSMDAQFSSLFNVEGLTYARETEASLKDVSGLSPGFSSEYVNIMIGASADERGCWEAMRADSIAKLSSIHGLHPALFSHIKTLVRNGKPEDALSMFGLCDGGVTPRMEFLVQHRSDVVEKMIAAKREGRDQAAGLLSTCAIQRGNTIVENRHSSIIMKLVESEDSSIQGFLSGVAVSEWAQLARDHEDLFEQMLDSVGNHNFKTARLCIAARSLGVERDYLALLVDAGGITDSNAEEVLKAMNSKSRKDFLDDLKIMTGEETEAQRDARLKSEREAAELAARQERQRKEDEAAKLRVQAEVAKRAENVDFIREMVRDTFPHPDEQVRIQALAAYNQVADSLSPDVQSFERLFDVLGYLPGDRRLDFFTRMTSKQDSMNLFANQEMIRRVTTLTKDFIPEAHRGVFVEQAFTGSAEREFYAAISNEGFERLNNVMRNVVPEPNRTDFLTHLTSTQGSSELFSRYDTIQRFERVRRLPAELIPDYLEHIITYSSNFENYTDSFNISQGLDLCRQLTELRHKAGLESEDRLTLRDMARNVFLRPPATYNLLTLPKTVEYASQVVRYWDNLTQVDRGLADAYAKAVFESPEIVNPPNGEWIVNVMIRLKTMVERNPEMNVGMMFLPDVWFSQHLDDTITSIMSGAPPKEEKPPEPEPDRTPKPHSGHKTSVRGEVRWWTNPYISVLPREPARLNPLYDPNFSIPDNVSFNSPTLGRISVAEVFQGVDTSVVNESEFRRIRPRLTYVEEQLLTAVSYYMASMLSRNVGVRPEVNVNEVRELCALHPLLGERYSKRRELFAEDLGMLRQLGAVEGTTNITLSERLWEVSFKGKTVDRSYRKLSPSVSPRILEKVNALHLTDPGLREQYRAFVLIMSNQQPSAIIESQKMIEECGSHSAFQGAKGLKSSRDLQKRIEQIRETLRNNEIVCSFRGEGYGIHPDYYLPGMKPPEYAMYPEVFNPLQTLKRCCRIEHYGGGVTPNQQFSSRVRNPTEVERNVFRLTLGDTVGDDKFLRGRLDITSSQLRLANERLIIARCLSNLSFVLDYGGKREHLINLARELLPEIRDVPRLLTMMRDRGVLEQPDTGLYCIPERYVRSLDNLRAARSAVRAPSAGSMDANIDEAKIYADVEANFSSSSPRIREQMKSLLRLMASTGVFVESGARLVDLSRLMRQVAREVRDPDILTNPSTIDGNVGALTEGVESSGRMVRRHGVPDADEVEIPAVPAVVEKAELGSVRVVRLSPQSVVVSSVESPSNPRRRRKSE